MFPESMMLSYHYEVIGLANIGINGYGRIGRILIRQLAHRNDLTVRAVNTRSELDECLLKYDSVFGRFDKGVAWKGSLLIVGENEIEVYKREDIHSIPWAGSIDAVVDCTGKFKTQKELAPHLKGNVRNVLLSCPPKDETPMYIFGVNEEQYGGESIISAASCTTAALAPIIKVLKEGYRIKAAHITTVHAVTTSDNLLDGSHKKDRRQGRAAMASIRETATGATKAVLKIFPELAGKLFVNAYRVPVANGSLLDMTIEFEEDIDAAGIQNKFRLYQERRDGILELTADPVVSCDCIGSYASAIVDLNSIKPTNKRTIKLSAFYDNEWGYTARIADLLRVVCRRQKTDGV